MNSKEVLKASFDSYVVMARLLKDNNEPSWITYLMKAKTCLELMERNGTQVIQMDQYLQVA